MLKRIGQRLKDLVLPFENPSHPLHYDHAAEDANRKAKREEQETFLSVYGLDFPDHVGGHGDKLD